ncbi:peroxidase family protein [Gordonia sp. Z-3]|uniref:peroxidase family protein n=1 Tax=Gordonia sp. Z-3 TaxID=3115408 RepID=UPI002E2DDE4D|nr:peroxidase family protein [Gordonia sp. Z-3]MED5803513.1 peroxidase family protein [Gordonia sp. Z-3]
MIRSVRTSARRTAGAEPTPRRRSATARGLAQTAERVDRVVGWSRLWSPVGLAVLVGLRSQLRAYNLVDTGRPGARLPVGTPDEHRARSVDGTYNDLGEPRAGSAGSRFGRNVPLPRTAPENADDICEPNPRLVSRRLLTRREFRPATTLNLLAAAWIQFEVHDWFNHAPQAGNPWRIRLPDGDDWPHDPMTFARTAVDPTGPDDQPPVFASTVSHWWDGSQIYGETADYAESIRTHDGGRIALDDVGLPPVETEALLDPNGQAANFWVGLALLHSLFLREHNAIANRLASAYPAMTDQQLYDTARLVNAASMAKIHTVDWTPAIIAHPTTVAAMRGNWFGLLGERMSGRIARFTDNEILSGIPGSATADNGVPFSLTEEFVAVYRMHPLLPDTVAFRSGLDDRVVARHAMADLLAADVRRHLTSNTAADLLYSFGRAHPGELSLHNFPRSLQNLARPDGTPIDLATVDIMRVRERGVPRYNDFRRALRMAPVTTFRELTGDDATATELAEIYGDIERLDLMIGLYAEAKPPGFGFSDTAFRIFILMASRRLSCDRFFTSDFRPEVYTEVGMAWVRKSSMRSVLLRHHPILTPALRSVANPFAPWRSAAASREDRSP